MIQLRRLRPFLWAKLRARLGRSFIIVGISSVLFGVALGGFTVITAALDSARHFSETAYKGHQLVQATHTRNTEGLTNNVLIQREAQAIYDKELAAKKAAAIAFGIEFNPSDVIPPLRSFPGGQKNDVVLDLASPAAQEAIKKYNSVQPGISIKDLEQTAKRYNARSVMPVRGLEPEQGRASIVRDGIELYPSLDQNSGTTDDFITTKSIRLVDESAVSPFINTSVKVGVGEVPILLPYSAAEAILSIQPLAKNASEKEILDRLIYLNTSVKTSHFSVCYRNDVSMQQIDQAVGNSNVSDNSIVYERSSGSCAPALIAKDVRSNAERQNDAKQRAFNEYFGVNTQPEQHELAFKVVGVMPDTAWAGVTNDNQTISIAQSLLGPSLLGQVTMTTQAYDQLPPTIQKLFRIGDAEKITQNDTYLVEFGTVQDARRFIQEQSCDKMRVGACGSDEYPFQLAAFGSSGIATVEMREGVLELSKYIVGTLAALAIIIMAGTFGKIIADEKRELAVLRVVGATRTDITLMYVSYAFMLSLFAALIAIALALGIAYLAHALFADELTVAMRLTYGVMNETVTVTLFAINFIGIVTTIVLVIITGVASILLPLQSALSKSDLIKDLKE